LQANPVDRAGSMLLPHPLGDVRLCNPRLCGPVIAAAERAFALIDEYGEPDVRRLSPDAKAKIDKHLKEAIDRMADAMPKHTEWVEPARGEQQLDGRVLRLCKALRSLHTVVYLFLFPRRNEPPNVTTDEGREHARELGDLGAELVGEVDTRSGEARSDATELVGAARELHRINCVARREGVSAGGRHLIQTTAQLAPYLRETWLSEARALEAAGIEKRDDSRTVIPSNQIPLVQAIIRLLRVLPSPGTSPLAAKVVARADEVVNQRVYSIRTPHENDHISWAQGGHGGSLAHVAVRQAIDPASTDALFQAAAEYVAARTVVPNDSSSMDVGRLEDLAQLAASKAVGAMEARATEDVTDSSGKGRKPGGWTRKELVEQAQTTTSFSSTVFDRIRVSAGVKAAEKGGKGQHRRFSIGELRKLIKAVEAGTFRYRVEIGATWRELLP